MMWQRVMKALIIKMGCVDKFKLPAMLHMLGYGN